MMEIKDKIVTVESLSALHEYGKNTYMTKEHGMAKTDIISVENGGTGATTAAGALSNLGLNANAEELNYISGTTSNIQAQLNEKQATIIGGATTIVSDDLTADRVLVSNGSGKVSVSDITSTELSYLDGVTSNVQTQLDGKSESDHTHDYLSLSGGMLTGSLGVSGLTLTSEIDYGDTLPEAGNVGRIFFKRLVE